MELRECDIRSLREILSVNPHRQKFVEEATARALVEQSIEQWHLSCSFSNSYCEAVAWYVAAECIGLASIIDEMMFSEHSAEALALSLCAIWDIESILRWHNIAHHEDEVH